MESGLVSIGLPVYNGQNFLEKTLKCLISQSYKDLEIIISDNASTDQTGKICKKYALLDNRIVYLRNKINKGASWNYNNVFYNSKGEYFKWAAHDDLFSKKYIEECIDVLNRNPSAILCHSKVLEIDENENFIKPYNSCKIFENKNPVKRLLECICYPPSMCAVFGVFRSSILKKTRLIGNYSSSDRTLLGEIALRGPIIEIPKYLFFFRSHTNQHFKIYRTKHDRYRWYDTSNNSRLLFPQWRLFYEHLISVNRVPLKISQRLFCNLLLVWWVRKNYRRLIKNLFLSE